MDASLFEKFNTEFDIAGLKEDVDAAKNRGDFQEVPVGDYEVKVTKLELGESKKGLPQAKVWFQILAGDFKGQLIFMNQNLTNGVSIRIMNDFLDSLESGVLVSFEDFVQYGDLLESIFEAIKGEAEYQLSYGENDKGFKTFNIVQRFKA